MHQPSRQPQSTLLRGEGGGEALAQWLEREVSARGWDIEVDRFECLGRCKDGPVIKLSPGGGFICEVTPDRLNEVLPQIEAFLEAAD
ncbi:hypothetical protein Ga0123462_1420 [Mariprofundus ferrinatatus]|uniref:Thioredoxin-like [2Fe-2S] ferredoxin n=1 Tax=Mariprofundus ferrinatatus TaxID=1921087 RepID=A0A2K8L4W8_9PROT|nr:hypothetical protein Ga0123462_1420 [Mariprofundus ferrinatatus]